jgi:hypothetical protein
MSTGRDRGLATPERKDSAIALLDRTELTNNEKDTDLEKCCHMDILPLEVKTRIFKYLSDFELVRVSRVCMHCV